MNPGKDRVDPYDTEDAGAHDDNDRRDDGLSDPTGCGDRTVHKRGHTVRKRHDLDPLHAGIDNGSIRGKQRQELMTKEKEEQSKDQSYTEGIKQADKVTLQNSFFVSCTVVLAHKTGTCDIKSIHDIINDRVRIGSRRISGDHIGIKGIDTALHEQVCDRKDRILDTCRDPDHQDGNAGVLVQSDFFQ